MVYCTNKRVRSASQNVSEYISATVAIWCWGKDFIQWQQRFHMKAVTVLSLAKTTDLYEV